MTVETTILLFNLFIASKYFAINKIITSPLHGVPVSSTRINLSASPSNAAPS
tara:strand:- start:212 stop:367 length:156 start_codon:yes stop_codon:yes gene_type:complete